MHLGQGYNFRKPSPLTTQTVVVSGMGEHWSKGLGILAYAVWHVDKNISSSLGVRSLGNIDAMQSGTGEVQCELLL